MTPGRPDRLAPTRLPALLLALLLALALAGTPACSEAGPEPVRLAAASSLAELAQRLAAGFEVRTGRPVTLRLGASSMLSRQLAEGAPGDVFLSADERWVAALAPLVSRPFLGNRLVWVVPAGAPPIAPAQATSMALGGEGVPLGRYAEQALAAAGLPLPPRVVRGADARATLAIVSSGAVDGGLVYATDAALDAGVVVAQTWPADPAHPLRAVAALLRPEGRALYDALDASWALELAAGLGFELLP